MRTPIWIFFLILNLFFIRHLAVAQAEDPAVPDLNGLNVPQAAAALRLANLALGEVRWDFSTAQNTNAIIGQEPIAGSALEVGGVVDVVVAQTPNIRLVYDDNDLTLINMSGGAIDLNGLLLARETDGRALPGARWPLEVLPTGGCLQVWSVARSVSKPVEGCRDITAWFSTGVTEVHVWTPLPEQETFSLSIAGELVADCQTAIPADSDNPRVCEGYVTPSPDPTTARYLYFSYTPGALVVKNPSPDLWMPLDVTLVGGGESVDLGAAALYSNTLLVVLDEDGWRVLPLAPGDCAVLFVDDPVPLPEACGLVIAEATGADFWAGGFRLGGQVIARTCPAASDDRLTVCVLQR